MKISQQILSTHTQIAHGPKEFDMKTNVNKTSIDNHEINKRAGLYGKQAGGLLDVIKKNPRGLNRNELSAVSGVAINAVTGRVNQLLGIGQLKTNGKRRCSVSGRVVWVLVA